MQQLPKWAPFLLLAGLLWICHSSPENSSVGSHFTQSKSSGPQDPTGCGPFTSLASSIILFAHSTPATLAMAFLDRTRYAPALRPLQWLFLGQECSPQVSAWLIHSFPLRLSSNVTLSKMPTLTTIFNTTTCHSPIQHFHSLILYSSTSKILYNLLIYCIFLFIVSLPSIEYMLHKYKMLSHFFYHDIYKASI